MYVIQEEEPALMQMDKYCTLNPTPADPIIHIVIAPTNPKPFAEEPITSSQNIILSDPASRIGQEASRVALGHDAPLKIVSISKMYALE